MERIKIPPSLDRLGRPRSIVESARKNYRSSESAVSLNRRSREGPSSDEVLLKRRLIGCGTRAGYDYSYIYKRDYMSKRSKDRVLRWIARVDHVEVKGIHFFIIFFLELL